MCSESFADDMQMFLQLLQLFLPLPPTSKNVSNTPLHVQICKNDIYTKTWSRVFALIVKILARL